MMMFPGLMSLQSISVSDDGNGSSAPRVCDFSTLMNPMLHNSSGHQDPQNKAKKKRNPPGNPHPDSEVIALSPRTLMATNRFVCEVCNRGFQRDQNLQLHRRGHNLPWKLKQRSNKEVNKKKVYVCPERTCVHHHRSRALGDLTGIKKHFCRKHGEKKWKCDMCAKVYAVESDWKTHIKTCGKEYRCNCGTVFTRKDSVVTHRAFCDASAEESASLSVASAANSILSSPPNLNTDHHNSFLHSLLTTPPPPPSSIFPFSSSLNCDYPNTWDPLLLNPHTSPSKDEEPYLPHLSLHQDTPQTSPMILPPFGHYRVNNPMPPPQLPATSLLQKAANIDAAMGQASSSSMVHLDMQSWARKDIGADVGSSSMAHTEMQLCANNSTTHGFTRDLMGLGDHFSRREGVRRSNNVNVREVMPSEFILYDRDNNSHVFSFSFLDEILNRGRF